MPEALTMLIDRRIFAAAAILLWIAAGLLVLFPHRALGEIAAVITGFFALVVTCGWGILMAVSDDQAQPAP